MWMCHHMTVARTTMGRLDRWSQIRAWNLLFLCVTSSNVLSTSSVAMMIPPQGHIADGVMRCSLPTTLLEPNCHWQKRKLVKRKGNCKGSCHSRYRSGVVQLLSVVAAAVLLLTTSQDIGTFCLNSNVAAGSQHHDFGTRVDIKRFQQEMALVKLGTSVLPYLRWELP